jgi:hypothetical protein
MIPSYVTPGAVWIFRDDSVLGDLRTDRDDPPASDDPSKFGGGWLKTIEVCQLLNGRFQSGHPARRCRRFCSLPGKSSLIP